MLPPISRVAVAVGAAVSSPAALRGCLGARGPGNETLASRRARAPGNWAQSCAEGTRSFPLPLHPSRGVNGQEGGREHLKLLPLLAETRVTLFYQRC